MDKKEIILVALFWGACAVFVLIREHIMKKKAATGEDLAKVRRVLARLLPDSTGYTTAYGFYKWSKAQGRRVQRFYYHYAVAFRPGELFIVPIHYAGGEVSAQGNGVLLTPENVGRAQSDGGGLVLFDLEGREICRVRVWAGYTRQDKYEPFNISQLEESQAFEEFSADFIRQVKERRG